MNYTPKRVQRETVLIALHGDGFIECFAAKNIDILIARVPHCPGSEGTAEDTFEKLLPLRYRQLYWPGLLRATAMNRPLLPSQLTEAHGVRKLIHGLNHIKPLEGVA